MGKSEELLNKLNLLNEQYKNEKLKIDNLVGDIENTIKELREEAQPSKDEVKSVSELLTDEIIPEKPQEVIPEPIVGEGKNADDNVNWFELPQTEPVQAANKPISVVTPEITQEHRTDLEDQNSIKEDHSQYLPGQTIETAEMMPDNIVEEKPKHEQYQQTPEPTKPVQKVAKKAEKSNIESFIGGNLLGKIGIFITLIGIFIGMKYAIDNGLIGPVAQLSLGYLAGASLAGIGLFLKKKYLNFSSVLLGGGLAVMYFVTYLGYSRFELLPQIPAFIIMLFITATTVYFALEYKQEIIAHIGLVGAYAIPFLVGNDKGQYIVFLSYTLLVNLGILYLSYRVYWKSLLYSSFILTWAVYFSWHIQKADNNIGMALFFSTAFFLVFYAAVLSYKLIRKENFKPLDTMLVLTNALVYFLFSRHLFTLSDWADDSFYITLLNSALHFGVFALVRSFKPADKTLYYISLGLGILFATIAIPMKFEGDWITLLWALEALLITFIACRKSDSTYFIFSFLVTITACFYLFGDIFLGLFKDIAIYYTPVLNVDFAVKLLTLVVFGSIFYMHRDYIRNNEQKPGTATALAPFYLWIIPAVIISAGLAMVHDQISLAFADGFYDQTKEVLCRYMVSFAYFAILTIADTYIFKSKIMMYSMRIVLFFGLFILLTVCLWFLGDLRDSFVIQDVGNEYFLYRYSLLACLIMGIYLITKDLPGTMKKNAVYIMSYTIGFIWVSNEYLTWTSIMQIGRQGRLALSIIWACYAVILIVHGIIAKNSILRISGISLIGVTIFKLIFYDLINANTLTKTIIFTGLGILLLITAYLYNRYKYIILGEPKNNEDTTEHEGN